jgi:hypothetical protein
MLEVLGSCCPRSPELLAPSGAFSDAYRSAAAFRPAPGGGRRGAKETRQPRGARQEPTRPQSPASGVGWGSHASVLASRHDSSSRSTALPPTRETCIAARAKEQSNRGTCRHSSRRQHAPVTCQTRTGPARAPSQAPRVAQGYQASSLEKNETVSQASKLWCCGDLPHWSSSARVYNFSRAHPLLSGMRSACECSVRAVRQVRGAASGMRFVRQARGEATARALTWMRALSREVALSAPPGWFQGACTRHPGAFTR